MRTIQDSIEAIAAETGFSGGVRVDRDGALLYTAAFGLAHRGLGIANTINAQFAIASGVKGFTALTVVSLIEEGQLELTTRARSILGSDLPLIGDDVTIEHLLAHRSGIGDYLDEDADHPITAYLMPVPVHELASTEDYLAVLDGHEAKFAPGDRFSYCNSGYVVLALLAERVSGTSFFELVEDRVCKPAGMSHTVFLRSDELPGSAALGYLTNDGARTNIFHLPVRGSGDGGIYSTMGDIHSFWAALFGGKIVSDEWVAEMVRPRSEASKESKRYGLGFWLHESRDVVMLEGYDAGVSFRTVHDPDGRFTYTVMSNTSDGAWALCRYLDEHLQGDG